MMPCCQKCPPPAIIIADFQSLILSRYAASVDAVAAGLQRLCGN
jgi:hypothetical protein